MRPFRHLFPATERGRALAALACAVVVLAGGVTAAATHTGDDALRVATEGDDRAPVPTITIPELPTSTLVDLPGLVTTTTIDVPVTVPPVTLPDVTLPSLPLLPREPGAVDEVEPLGLYVVRPDGTGLRRLADHCLARRPAWSPDGTRLACLTKGNVATVVRVSDGSATFLGPSSGHSFSWSPDGTRVAFIQGPHSPRDVAVAPADGSSPAVVLRTPHEEYVATWGPDGRLASMGYEGLWTFAADGSAPTHVYEEPLDFGRLTWSPDGSQLLAAHDSTNDVVMNADGSNVRPLGNGHGGETSGLAWDADWAPDSRRVVWYENGWRTGSEILHVGLPEGPWVEIARDVGQPDWSPVADVIAGVRSGGRELVTVGAAGGDVRVVLHAARTPMIEPSWSPDGSLIAFGTTQDYDIPPQ